MYEARCLAVASQATGLIFVFVFFLLVQWGPSNVARISQGTLFDRVTRPQELYDDFCKYHEAHADFALPTSVLISGDAAETP